jgi:hypothetical protein
MPDEKLALPCPQQIHERRRITPRQQFLQRLEPHRIGGVEPQFAILEGRRLENLREPFVDVCTAEGISPSEGLRRLIAAAVEGGNGVQAVQAKHRGRAEVERGDCALQGTPRPC